MNETHGWDSLQQMNLMMEVENEFQIQLTVSEIMECNSFKNILGVLTQKQRAT